jgi:hypothetical protein
VSSLAADRRPDAYGVFFRGAFLFLCVPLPCAYMYMLLWCGAAHIPVPIGCEHFVVVGLTHIEADTMTLRGYKSRKSTRSERVLSLQLPC